MRNKLTDPILGIIAGIFMATVVLVTIQEVAMAGLVWGG